MNPADLAKPDTEHAHQVALFCQAAKYIDLWPELEWMYAIPNGGERNIIVAGRLKAEGVKSGISDVCLPCARKGYHGFYIEMKKPDVINTKNGGASANQLKFGAHLTTQGYLFTICHSWIEAWERILWYLE